MVSRRRWFAGRPFGAALKPLPAHALLEEGNFRRKKIPVFEGHFHPTVHDAFRRIARLSLAPCFGVSVFGISESCRRTIVPLFPAVDVLRIAST
jgi:hypothetical protein